MKLNYLKHKAYILKTSLREEGLVSTFKKKIIPFLVRPIEGLIKRSNSLMEIRYGILSNLNLKEVRSLIYRRVN